MPVTVFIADDEELARAKLRQGLAARPDLRLVGEAADGETAVREIEKLKPRLLLLDIQMPAMSGFEVVRALSYTPQIIFTTAFDQYAIQAFEIHSLDYLLKPYGSERLNAALDRALAMESTGGEAFARQLRDLLKTVRTPDRLACQKKGEIYFVSPSDIVWVESADTLTFVHTAGDKLRINRTLNELEEQLAEADFIRCHRAALVNLKFVRKLTPLFNGGFEMTVEHCAHPLPLSRRQAQKIKGRFGW